MMDDSDQDFVDLCSKLLKRVRKKPGESSQPRNDHQACSQTSDRDKRRRNTKKDTDSASQPASAGAEQAVDSGGTGQDSGDAGSKVVPSAAAGPRTDRGQRAKDKVLLRMQQFKRASPQKMVHADKSQPTSRDCAPFAVQQREGTPESFSSAFHPEPPDSDEALALQLQQELDREAAEAQTVDLEDGGLFFCQICHKDLSHMTPEGRTQHLNRCLDESEESAPAPAPAPAPPPSVPDCPICGKKFKSQKSRSAHLKRCSSDMGVSPAVLLQALQRQAEENKSTSTANSHIQTVGTKRKGPSKPGLPAKKKPRKKTEPMDEETMVALALSSSLLEQQKEQLRDTEAERQLQPEIVASHSSMTPLLKWRTDTGKGRGKKKKGAIPRPPPLLLVQDAEAALTRLQERVSALLLRSRAPSPPSPTLCPSTLPGWSGAAPLWQKSTLLDGGSTSVSDFYAPQLREFFTPQESVTTNAASFSTTTKPESSVQPVAERTPLSGTRASILPSPSTASCSPVPSTQVGSQVLRDLMELAEEGMTLSQYGYTARDTQINAGLSTNLRLSGFIQEESEEQLELCASGFLPEKTDTNSEETYSQAVRTTDQPRTVKETKSHQSVTLSRLASDLSSMVNNPQLSDVQLQVDSGEIYFAHSLMMYARCPLLAEMVHESGFGVQEEDMPAGKRVLINDVPGQAVFTLLQYLYTAHCSIPASLQPHILELASRFDLPELQQLCQLHPEEAAALRDEADYRNQEENYNNRTDQAIQELLRSMWNGEDEDDDGADSDGQDEGRRLEEDRQADEVASGDREIREEQVNEEELEEIYEFAATQKKREETDSQEEEEEEEEEARIDEEDGDAVFTKLTEHKTGFCEKNLRPNSEPEPDPSLDRSYNRLFSDSWGVYEEGDRSSAASTSALTKTTQSKQHKSPHKPSSEISGRILLQSSASLVDDLSLSPPPSTSNMPTAGLSPGPVGDLGGSGDKGEDAVEQDAPLKRESQGPRSICIPPPTDSPKKKEEPELIVLSDSSEEMEVDVAVLSSQSPLTFSPCIQSYTEIKSKQIPPRNAPALDNKESSSLELSPADPLACSPELSWLIPSTPVHPGRSTTSSSTQTQSSMCRTRLFPKGDASPPSSSAFSSPALPSNSTPHTSNSPTKVSADVGPTEDSVSRLKLNRMTSSSSSLDLNVFPNKSSNSSSLLSKSTNSYSLKASLKQDTPLHLKLQLHSSTPLHIELHQPPVLLAASPLHTDPDEQRSAPSESPETTELGSFHLSPLSDPSERHSSSSHSRLQNSKRHSKSSSQHQHSIESSSRNNAKVELTRREERNEGLEGDNKNVGGEEQEDAKGETGGTDVAESSFQQSFLDMDEPPIAFNDSWGLEACVDNSLRLEDSGPSSQQEHSPGRQETASPPSNRSAQSLNNRDSVTPPSPPKGQQPSCSLQAQTSPEFDKGLLDSKIWDSWEEEEEEEVLPLSQRLNPSAQLKTPVATCSKRRRSLVPITPMPHYSDMDTPELKNKLNRFGVRPLPKRQMILKLKEIHQYTHQLVSSDSEDEDEAPPAGQTAHMKPPVSRPASSDTFKQPLTAVSPAKHHREDEAEPLPASQGSNTSSTAASEESERSNPELCVSSDGESDSDAGISCSQAASRLQDRLKAVRSFILSNSQLYSQILQYQPLVLSQLQQQLKAAGIRLGAAKLVDYLDSQCITFTTAKPGRSAPSRRQGKRTDRGAKAGGQGARRKKVVAAMI